MSRKQLSILPLLAFFTILQLFSVRNYVIAETFVSGHKIVIDAGHGGTDTGSTECVGYPESNANLDIAKLLKRMLEGSGATVYMTRNEYNETRSNADRYNYANSNDVEVLVSVHLNGSTNHSIDGSQGLYGKRVKDEAFTKVMHDSLMGSLNNLPNFTDFGVTNFASGVLLKSNMPATIQEAVFISNTDECNALKAGTRQPEIAQALFDGLNKWFAQNNSGGGGGGKCDTPPCGKNK